MAAEPVVAVVQARMGSTRFPGKTLAPFAGTTVLRHLLDRLRAVAHPLDLCVATTDLREDDAVVAECEAAGVAVYRGAADDVLARFAGCIRSLAETPSLVLRVCADRPLLCPVLADELLDAYDELGRPDYLANNLPPSYPAGLDLELVRVDCLEQAARESEDAYEREHVKLALDTRDDYERLTGIHQRLSACYDYRDILTAVELAA